MAADIIDLLLNLSLVFAILIAPSALLLSVWYKTSLGKAVFTWPKSEMVLLTIIFFVVALVLFIVGVSCIFTYFGYLDPIRFPGINVRQFLNLGLCCNFHGVGLGDVVCHDAQSDGTIGDGKWGDRDQGLLALAEFSAAPKLEQNRDYYIVPDFPNITVTFIVAEEELRFERHSIKVPVYLKGRIPEFSGQGPERRPVPAF